MTLFGVDVSHYQAGFDMARAAREGASFAIAKISQGASSRDAEWTRHRDRARAAGLLIAGYHYVTTDTPNRQAANCHNAIGDLSVPVALDWEDRGGDWRNFMATLVAFRAAGLRVVLAYCPRWYWQKVGSPDMSRAALPLWSSRYPSTASGPPAQLYKAVTGTHWAGYGGLGVALVQFTDKAAIAGAHVDCSAFNGTRDQLAALFGGAPHTLAPASAAAAHRPPEEDAMYIQYQPDKSKPDTITAIYSGGILCGLGTPGELDSANGNIAAGATAQWVDQATWEALDAASKRLQGLTR